ncbi:glycoside hydrolase family 1 protein [Psychromonas ossibalaenae]|uniref:glycoside hydrolase family 1 protein n=1 Tax=Psychromonas ossibalaenae TaxID=444922 RepID=UPI0003762494|nr:family 1 glycosylhydrolase [Psychromonas ossibalaenae]
MNKKLTLVCTILSALLIGCNGDRGSQNLSDERRVDVNRSVDLKFPDGFLWGGATASFQVEGTHPYFENDNAEADIITGYLDGKSRSKWDVLTEGPVNGGLNLTYGERAYTIIDQYHRFESDFDILEDLNLNAYRFSVAWTRIVPNDGAPMPLNAIEAWGQLPSKALVDGASAGSPVALGALQQYESNFDRTPFEGLFNRLPDDTYSTIAAAIRNANAKVGDVVPVVLTNGKFTYAAAVDDPTNDDASAPPNYILQAGYYPLNYKGIRHYKEMIDSLVSRGITPVVTMYHWDMPLSLWAFTFRSWSSRSTIEYFENYAEVLLTEYGQQVGSWITVNEPFSDACVSDGVIGGVVTGVFSAEFLATFNDKVGFNIDILGTCVPQLHNIYTGHARIKKMYEEMKNGVFTSKVTEQTVSIPSTSRLGIVVGAGVGKPVTNEPLDRKATEMYDRAWAGMWLTPFAHKSAPAHSSYNDLPFFRTDTYQYDQWAVEYFRQYGSYLIKEDCEADLSPAACAGTVARADVIDDWKLMAEVSMDFIGTNYYRRPEVHMIPPDQQNHKPDDSWYDKNSFSREVGLTLNGSEAITSANGRFDPSGLYEGLQHLQHEFPDAEIMITETGASYERAFDGTNQESLSDSNEIDDFFRIRFTEGMVETAWKAQNDGIKLIGMMPWSTFDNFEWTSATKSRFGLIHIDYDSPDLDRVYKDSAIWYQGVAAFNGLQAKF